MNRATNVPTSRKRRVQRGLALAFHLEEPISIESSCELEDHQRGDVKMWLLLLLLLLLLCVCVLKQSTFALWTEKKKEKQNSIMNSRFTDFEREIRFFHFVIACFPALVRG